MVKPDQCFVARADVPLDQQLGDKVADGRMSEADADTVRLFDRFLREWGKPTAQGLDVATLVRRVEWLDDPERCAFLGFDDKQRDEMRKRYVERIEALTAHG